MRSILGAASLQIHLHPPAQGANVFHDGEPAQGAGAGAAAFAQTIQQFRQLKEQAMQWKNLVAYQIQKL